MIVVDWTNYFLEKKIKIKIKLLFDVVSFNS